MGKIGIVEFVQIQRSPLKIHQESGRIFRPDPLLQVETLIINHDGIVGCDHSGAQITDVHHVHHPQSRYRGNNKISFGFTQQYQRIQERFGDHIHLGDGGENIIVEALLEDVQTFDHQRTYYFKHGDTHIMLANVLPAPPCREFSTYCLSQVPSAQQLKTTLQFLDGGTRGYYADLAQQDDVYHIQAGDELWVL